MTLPPPGPGLTPEEEARCAAMAERAAVHSAEAEGYAKQLAALRAKHRAVVTETLALILVLHICNRARSAALGCSPPTLEDTVDRHGILCRASLDQPLTQLRECQH